MPSGRSKRPRRSSPEWVDLPTEKLLDVRLCDLGLKIEHSALAERVGTLYEELERAGLRFRPYVWLSTDWFTPDAYTGFAVPFFLAHPRLAKLERRLMLQVEGGTQDWCSKLLRHETGHAIDNAYRLHRRRRWREVFGRASEPYRENYMARPGSRHYVINLDFWYAQSHPLEDFAETFAIWLRPGKRWKRRYAGTPAMRKLQYVDELMAELSDRAPTVRTRAHEDALKTLTMTLREYYRRKQARYNVDFPVSYDRSLQRLFPSARRGNRTEAAGVYLQRVRGRLRRTVASVTEHEPYLVDQIVNEIILRCRLLGLRKRISDRAVFLDACVLVAALSTSYASGRRAEFQR